jgi:hypothetical protein
MDASDVNAVATDVVGVVSKKLFGDEWAPGLARFTAVNLRTCQRIKAAFEATSEEPRSMNVLVELSTRLQGLSGLLPDFSMPDQVVLGAIALPKHVGVHLYGDERSLRALRDLVGRSTDYCGDEGAVALFLLALSYDLRKAADGLRDRVQLPPEWESEEQALAVKVAWPIAFMQLKLLRAIAGYISLSLYELDLLKWFETGLFEALMIAYSDDIETATDVIEAYSEMGVDIEDDDFGDKASARAGWFLSQDEVVRKRDLPHLFESMSVLYDGRAGGPPLQDLEEWTHKDWPDFPELDSAGDSE